MLSTLFKQVLYGQTIINLMFLKLGQQERPAFVQEII